MDKMSYVDLRILSTQKIRRSNITQPNLKTIPTPVISGIICNDGWHPKAYDEMKAGWHCCKFTIGSTSDQSKGKCCRKGPRETFPKYDGPHWVTVVSRSPSRC